MPPTYHVGQRLSFKSFLCTVRYIGPIEGTDKEWLGIEWDDPRRGKHDGERDGKRYFNCLNSSPTAGSFITVKSSKADPPQSFIEAVRAKYATDTITQPNKAALQSHQVTVISGKTVEEVGFEKIQREQSQLNKLKIVLVDGQWIDHAESEGIRDACPRIVDLDLSRNLFEDCGDIMHICGELDNLRSLRLNGNRLQVLTEELAAAPKAFQSVTSLEMDEMLLSWDDTCILASQFETLNHLTASSNAFVSLNSPLTPRFAPHLVSLTLEYNRFTNLDALLDLRGLPSLESLHLKGNYISELDVTHATDGFGPNLHYLDLSYNKVSSWNFVDALADFLPGLSALRLSNNPIYDDLAKQTDSPASLDDGYMLTLARIGNLKTLNFSDISAEERRNAEMFYLSRIGQEIAKVSENEENAVTSNHKRYAELCEIYGAPIVVRKSAETINPDFLEARLIKFTLYLPPNTKTGNTITKVQEIPKGFDIYRVKGIVGRLFDIRPLSLNLIWETGEWDPVAGYEEAARDEDSDKEAQDKTFDGRWMKREVVIEDSTRQIGFCVDGTEATVRVELR